MRVEHLKGWLAEAQKVEAVAEKSKVAEGAGGSNRKSRGGEDGGEEGDKDGGDDTLGEVGGPGEGGFWGEGVLWKKPHGRWWS